MAQPSVFISHASPDTIFANRLADDLRNLGADVWLDATHMGPGNFVTRINQALQRDALILVLSPDAIASQWVQQEMSAAITRTNQGLMRPPIVVMARPVAVQSIPPLWTVYHRYDAVQNYALMLGKIYQEIKIAYSSINVIPPSGAQILIPHSAQQLTKVQASGAINFSRVKLSYPWMVWSLILVTVLEIIGIAWLFYTSDTGMIDWQHNMIAIIALSLGSCIFLLSLIQGLIICARLKRWGWFVSILILLIVSGFAAYPPMCLWPFALWGPKEKRI